MLSYTIACSFVQVFNTGLLLVIASTKFKGDFIELVNFQNGLFVDIEPLWFLEMCPFIYSTYVFCVVWPLIEFTYMWFFGFLYRGFDQGMCCCRDKKKTRAKTVLEYVAIYSGPELDIHNKYAAMVNLVFVAFMHGLTMPLLFPLALLGILIQMSVDRLRLAY